MLFINEDVFIIFLSSYLAFFITTISGITESFSITLFKKDWERYRLGDCIRYHPLIGPDRYRRNKDFFYVEDFLKIKKDMPNSICGRLLNDPKYLTSGFDRKAKVVDQLTKQPGTDTDYIGVHVRVGDVLKGKHRSNDFYWKGLGYYKSFYCFWFSFQHQYWRKHGLYFVYRKIRKTIGLRN